MRYLVIALAALFIVGCGNKDEATTDPKPEDAAGAPAPSAPQGNPGL